MPAPRKRIQLDAAGKSEIREEVIAWSDVVDAAGNDGETGGSTDDLQLEVFPRIRFHGYFSAPPSSPWQTDDKSASIPFSAAARERAAASSFGLIHLCFLVFRVSRWSDKENVVGSDEETGGSTDDM